jgi:hypothetical protein
MSAVMVGLGMVAGILRWFPQMFSFPYLPVIPHIMLVLPFVIRLMVPAIERIDPMFAEQASLLPLSGLAFGGTPEVRFCSSLPPWQLLYASLFHSASSAPRSSLSGLGRGIPLSILVDQVASRPKFDPYVFPTAMALATISWS